MIKRIWHGWTTEENADRYEELLREEIFPGIAAKQIQGYRGVELLRRAEGEEVEFVTIMSFDSLEDVKAFAGENYATAYVPSSAREILTRFDERSRHYEMRGSWAAAPGDSKPPPSTGQEPGGRPSTDAPADGVQQPGHQKSGSQPV